MDLIFPFKWPNNEVKGVLKILLTPINYQCYAFFIAFVTSFNYFTFHLPLLRKPRFIATFFCLDLLAWLGKMFSLSSVGLTRILLAMTCVG